VVSGNTVVTAGNDFPSGSNIQAINLSTGAAVWSKTFDNDCAEPALVVHAMVIYNDCDASKLVAATLSSGTKVWTRAGVWAVERGDTDTTGARHLYAIPSSGIVTDLNPSSGATHFTLAGATHTLAVDGLRVYAACTQGLCAYNRGTGALEWSESSAGGWNVDTSHIAIGGAVLYGANGTVLNASTGVFLAILSDQPGNSVAVGDDRVAFTDNNRIIDLYGLSGS
jgi:outer membrane protein assembly factor BamB